MNIHPLGIVHGNVIIFGFEVYIAMLNNGAKQVSNFLL